MDNDPEVRDRVYRLRRVRDLMRLGFGHAQPLTRYSREVRKSGWRKYSMGLAASVVTLAITFGAGVLGYQAGKQIDFNDKRVAASVANEQSQRVLLHINEADPRQFAAALDYAQGFIKEYRARGGEVAVVAHSTGIDLMRIGVSPYEDQVREIIANYDNIHFIACANAISALRKKGVEPRMMRDADTSKPAMDQIIEHVQDGWDYVKVKSLVPEIQI